MYNRHFVSASAGNIIDSKLYQSLANLDEWYIPHFYSNNKESLASVYNKAIAEIIENRSENINTLNDKDIITFVHDDVEIEDINLFKKLEAGLQKYNIVGLAGTKQFELKFPPVWNNTDYKNYTGAVAHTKDGEIWMTSFGKFGKALILDGLFLSIELDTIKKYDLSFDENISNFHFYDIDFCLSAHNKKVTMGTIPIWVTHNSIGDWTKSNDWKVGAEKFMQKWSKVYTKN